MSSSLRNYMPERADRFFSGSSAQKSVARTLFESVADFPLICPHGHVDPLLFADASYHFSSPAEFFLIPDHYVFRMLYSQGVPLEAQGVPMNDGEDASAVESDHRKIWQTFVENYHLFQGTPTGLWLRDELHDLFGITERLTPANAQATYDRISEQLAAPDFTPRKLYEQFQVEVLTTTDAATDTLEHHKTIRKSSWDGRIYPTFRPDKVVNGIDQPEWKGQIDLLRDVSGIDIGDYVSYITALEARRDFFREMGATATDHAAETPFTEVLSPKEVDAIFQRGLVGSASADDARRFTAHMLVEMARMSSEDGLVMQLHPGSIRNHNSAVFQRFGADKGADIPHALDFTLNLKPLLDRFGSHPSLRLILFTLDESTSARELAPLAGHYPILRIGPPWWFYDSINGMRNFFAQVIETAGIYNTVGFNDDTRAFASIPTRHELWRRIACDWLAGLLVEGQIDDEDALAMAHALAYGLAKEAYRL